MPPCGRNKFSLRWTAEQEYVEEIDPLYEKEIRYHSEDLQARSELVCNGVAFECN